MAQVVAQSEHFRQRQLNVVTISFATERYWAEAWLHETASPFPLLLDPQRQAYTAYGLARSLWRSWGVNSLNYYARALWRGGKLQLDRGDTGQLGGDFVVDSQGIIRLAYPSRDPTDRPAIASLLL